MPATKTLPECAADTIEQAIEDAADDDPIVLWWDDGGYLRDIVEQVSRQFDCAFHAADRTPLELRQYAPRDRTVWYVPRGKNDRRWFKDVEETGTVIEKHIGKLASQCFTDAPIQATQLHTAYETSNDRDAVAHTLHEALIDDTGGFPSLQSIQTQIILEGNDDPVRFVLEYNTTSLSDSERDATREKIQQIRDLLINEGVNAVKNVTDSEAIVDQTRQWAVAEWLVDEGLDPSQLPEEYRPEQQSGFGIYRPKLHSVLSKSAHPDKLAAIYLDPSQRFWDEILRTHGKPWELADCPVGPTLEHQLFTHWMESFNDGEYEICITHATDRHSRLETIYGDVSWTRTWKQAIAIARLAKELDEWNTVNKTDDVVSLYGDIENGTWQIDNAVYSLAVSGSPEDALPEEHPATGTLGGIRETLVESTYLEYLSDLSKLVSEQVADGSPFVEYDHAHQFFASQKEHLQSGQSVALFIIDALRFDLAHELAESIRNRMPTVDVDEDTWVGTLPSDTDFGKAALTPGSKFSFEIAFEDDALIPKRNGQKITYYRRKKLLENDGWSYIVKDKDDEAGWSNTRVAFYWNDIDESGEKELTNFESIFSDRLTEISDIITEKLKKGVFDRAYILADHGFVSLPKHVDINDIHPPASAKTVTRRWVAGNEISDHESGVLLDENAHLGYLNAGTEINLLADPIERFRNQGLPDARFYHGGILPQEFVLNFVTITPE